MPKPVKTSLERILHRAIPKGEWLRILHTPAGSRCFDAASEGNPRGFDSLVKLFAAPPEQKPSPVAERGSYRASRKRLALRLERYRLINSFLEHAVINPAVGCSTGEWQVLAEGWGRQHPERKRPLPTSLAREYRLNRRECKAGDRRESEQRWRRFFSSSRGRAFWVRVCKRRKRNIALWEKAGSVAGIIEAMRRMAELTNEAAEKEAE